MSNRNPLELDMTVDGRFRQPPQAPLPMRIGAVALILAILTGAIAAAALLFWFALALIPVAIGAAAVAWVAFRVQLWRMRRSGRLGRAVFRP